MTKQDAPKKFEPGVQQFLDQEESREIVEEFKSTTINLGYRPPRKKFKSTDINEHKPVSTFSPEIWEKFNMNKDFSFVQECIDAGYADENGNLIITTTATTIVKKVAILALINMKAVRIMTKSYINPKSSMTVEGNKYMFGSGDLKNFIAHHFPQQDEIIRGVNATDVMKSIMIWIEDNPVRKREPLNILTVVDPNTKRRMFYLDSIFTLLSLDQAVQLTAISKKKPHFTMAEATELFTSLIADDIEESMVYENEKEDPDYLFSDEEINEAVNQTFNDSQIFDDSIMPADELSPMIQEPNEISVDQVINLNVLKKILGNGDSVTITIQYTKSSSGE